MSRKSYGHKLDSEDQGVQMSEVGGRLVAVLDGFVAQSQAQLKLNIKIIGLSMDVARERRHGIFNMSVEKEE
jgi:hypothetical protein